MFYYNGYFKSEDNFYTETGGREKYFIPQTGRYFMLLLNLLQGQTTVSSV